MTVVYVTASVLRETGRLLASFAEGRDSEGVVYWFGLELEERAVVTTMIVPDADAGTGAVQTSASANAEAVGVVAGTPLVLLGQAHSHPSHHVGHPPWTISRRLRNSLEPCLSWCRTTVGGEWS